VPPGAKMKRGIRVKDYLNTLIFYRMEGWEEDTDQLLATLPIIGCAFRKVSFVDGMPKVRLLSALKLIVPSWATDCETAPRMTEVIDNLATYQVEAMIKSGDYRDVTLVTSDDDKQKPRIILEQHRFEDLDGDGTAEPYIITVDKETAEILRIEANFDREAAMNPGSIKKRCIYYVKYGFFPNPNGSFYPIGFGHLLDQIEHVINSLINQMLDAGTAQIAGGGFVASGLRLQGRSGGSMRFKPGEYKTVDATGGQLRDGIYERTFPNVSPVTFQLLDMMMMAAKDITSVKDVITGDASNNGQVGTTLALIEQSLAQFSAVYKRVYRSLKTEFQMLYDYCGKWGGPPMAEDYANVLDDMAADFEKDFNGKDFDIRPISDPTNVTKAQKLGQAQFLLGLRGAGLDDMEIHRRALEAADIEEVDKFFPKQQGPDPMQMLAMEQGKADIIATEAKAGKDDADTLLKKIEASNRAMETGFQLGMMDDGGGVPDMESGPGNGMDNEGLQDFSGETEASLG
jgi:chaperonin GroES